MTSRLRIGLGTTVIGLGLAALPMVAPGQQAQSPALRVKVGLVNSLFRDVPPTFVQAMMPPFQNLLRDQTGLDGEVLTAGDAHELGQKLHEQSMQFGIFHGFEFAWAREKYTDLKPLVIAVNRHRFLKAYVVVRDDSKASGLADLKGKIISVPKRSRPHALLFFDRELSKMGAEPKSFFGQSIANANIEEALDDVVRDKVQAALVDQVALESYELVKPGVFARLKVLKESQAFPPGVVGYREGSLDAATLAKFREGMGKAHQTARGKDLMSLWKLTAFEEVPADFEQSLQSILKAYPPPAPARD